MSLARKLLIPTLLLFVLIFGGLLGYLILDAVRQEQAHEQQRLEKLGQALSEKLQRYEDIALLLARQTASNAEVQKAFAEADRDRLLALTLPSYREIKQPFGIAEQQFILKPASLFLQLDDPENYGDDLSASRLSLVVANQQQREVNEMEISARGLAMRGIAPIDLDDHKGIVEVAVRIDGDTLNTLKQEYGGEWQLYLRREPMQKAGFPGEEGGRPGPIADLTLQATTLDGAPAGAPEIYQQALLGQPVAWRSQPEQGDFSAAVTPLRDFSGQVVGVIEYLVDFRAERQALLERALLIGLLGLAGLGMVGALLIGWVRRELYPVRGFVEAAQAITAGDLSQRAPVSQRHAQQGGNELELLGRSFNQLAEQLEQLVGKLEEGVSERTAEVERRSRQLRAATEIAGELSWLSPRGLAETGPSQSRPYSIDILLERAVEMIEERFDFYHAGVFLIDESGEYAVLRAAAGPAGRQMVASGHRLRVGRVGIVGASCGDGRPHVVQDVTDDQDYFQNPLLPETRSEMALPLRVGSQVIGALDVQSRHAQAFDEGDITVLQMTADQLATALDNALLMQDMSAKIAELEQAAGLATRKNWADFVERLPHTRGYAYQQGRAALQSLSWSEAAPAARAAVQGGAVIRRLPNPKQDSLDGSGDELAVPVKLRGQVIGVMHLHFDSPQTANEMAGLVEEFGQRLALMLESSRLLAEAQRLASREQQINWIVSQVRSSVEMESVLSNTVRELGKALGASRAFIQIGNPDASPGPGGDDGRGQIAEEARE